MDNYNKSYTPSIMSFRHSEDTTKRLDLLRDSMILFMTEDTPLGFSIVYNHVYAVWWSHEKTVLPNLLRELFSIETVPRSVRIYKCKVLSSYFMFLLWKTGEDIHSICAESLRMDVDTVRLVSKYDPCKLGALWDAEVAGIVRFALEVRGSMSDDSMRAAIQSAEELERLDRVRCVDDTSI